MQTKVQRNVVRFLIAATLLMVAASANVPASLASVASDTDAGDRSLTNPTTTSAVPASRVQLASDHDHRDQITANTEISATLAQAIELTSTLYLPYIQSIESTAEDAAPINEDPPAADPVTVSQPLPLAKVFASGECGG